MVPVAASVPCGRGFESRHVLMLTLRLLYAPGVLLVIIATAGSRLLKVYVKSNLVPSVSVRLSVCLSCPVFDLILFI